MKKQINNSIKKSKSAKGIDPFMVDNILEIGSKNMNDTIGAGNGISDEEPEVYSLKKSTSPASSKRREFIANSFIAGAAISLGAASVAGCKKEATVTSRSDYKSFYQIMYHSSYIDTVVFSPDGKTLVSGSSDKKIKYWHIPGGILYKTNEVHQNRVDTVIFNPAGTMLVSASDDNTVFIWNFPDGSFVKALEGHDGARNSIVISPDGKMLASADDREIKIWSFPEGLLLKTIISSEQIFSVDLSSDGKKIISASGQKIFIWSFPDGILLQTLEGHTSNVSTAICSPKEDIIVSGSFDYTIKLWNISEGSLIMTLKEKWAILSIAISKDGKMLATGSQGSGIKIWSLPEGKLLNSFTEQPGWIGSVAFSPDGKMLAAGIYDPNGSNKIIIWDLTAASIRLNACTCNTVCSCNTVSDNNGSDICTCNSITTCTCNLVCSCNSVCTCDSNSGGGSSYHTYWYPN